MEGHRIKLNRSNRVAFLYTQKPFARRARYRGSKRTPTVLPPRFLLFTSAMQ